MSQRTSLAVRVAVGAALALGLAGCTGSGQAPRVDVTPSVDLPDSVPLGEPLDMGYTWQTGTGFSAPAEDYQVFVHMVDPQGEIVFQDDHYPPQPTSQWTGTETYRRWVYPPEDLEVEYLDIVVGLYSQDGRAQVRDADGEWVDEVQVHRLQIRADDMSGIPVYMDGWHPAEEPADALSSWRWTQQVAHAVFTNPGKDAVLHLRAHGPYDQVGPQTVTLRIGDREVASFQVESNDNFLRRIEIPADAMGDNDWVELTLEVSPVFVPKQANPDSQDDRTLGLQVFNMYLSSS